MNISVAMAVYNGEKYILEQLESIITQTRTPDELVISDDRSSDGTLSLIEKFCKLHKNIPMTIKVVENDIANSGPASNFENAVRNTTGDIIFLCDQDDIWIEDKVQRISGVMERHNENVVFHDAGLFIQKDETTFELTDQSIYRNGNDLYKASFDEEGLYKITKDKYFWLCYKYNLINGMCMCIRREYLFSILPFSKGGLHDAWICFCAIADDTLLSVKDILAYYRIHRLNTTQIRGQKKNKNYLKSLRTYDKRSQEVIKKKYLWYMDVNKYAGQNLSTLKEFNRDFSFYTDRRIALLKKGKAAAVYEAVREYINESYETEGKALLYHDLELVLFHSKSFREKMMHSMEQDRRL